MLAVAEAQCVIELMTFRPEIIPKQIVVKVCPHAPLRLRGFLDGVCLCALELIRARIRTTYPGL